MIILFVHGIGHADLDQNYYVQWETDVYGSTQILRSESVNSSLAQRLIWSDTWQNKAPFPLMLNRSKYAIFAQYAHVGYQSARQSPSQTRRTRLLWLLRERLDQSQVAWRVQCRDHEPAGRVFTQ